jgi:hypothetical protein
LWPIFLKNFSIFLFFCFLTPGKNWQQEFILKFCVLSIIYGILEFFCILGDIPNGLGDMAFKIVDMQFFIRQFIKPFVFGACLENVLLMWICRLAIRFHVPDFWTFFIWGLFFGGLHVLVKDIDSISAIPFFWVITGMDLSWYRSKNSFLIIILFHGLWNFNASIFLMLFGRFFEYWFS